MAAISGTQSTSSSLLTLLTAARHVSHTLSYPVTLCHTLSHLFTLSYSVKLSHTLSLCIYSIKICHTLSYSVTLCCSIRRGVGRLADREHKRALLPWLWSRRRYEQPESHRGGQPSQVLPALSHDELRQLSYLQVSIHTTCSFPCHSSSM